MIIPFLVPRLNYCFSIRDLCISIRGLFFNSDETQIKELFKNENIYFFNHARTGLRLILNSLNLPANAKIGVQAYNCITVFNAISLAGYAPVFIDISHSYSLDPEDLRSKVMHIDALIITHTFGLPADIDKIKSIIGNKPIIEDCAHSFMSYYKNVLTGTFGDFAIFSHGGAKFPSAGEGGFVMINNTKYLDNLIEKYKGLKKPRLKDEIFNIFRNISFGIAYNPVVYGLLTISAGRYLDRKFDLGKKSMFAERREYRSNKSLFFSKLLKKDILLEMQKSNGRKIMDELKKNKDSESFITDGSNYFMIPIRVNKNREQIISLSVINRTEFGKHFSNSIKWASRYNYKPGSCPNAERTCSDLITIPCHYNYPQWGIKRIISLINELNYRAVL